MREAAAGILRHPTTEAVMDGASGTILATAAQVLRTRDRLGRELAVRRLTALDRLRLFKAIGAQLAENAPYLGMAILASSVIAIDGVPVPPPATEAQLEGAVQRLGDDGMDAIGRAFEQMAASEMTDAEAGN